MPPATLAGERTQSLGVGLRDDRHVDPLPGMLGRAIELVDHRDAGWTGALGERQLRRLARLRAGAVVQRAAREHEAVDDERVLAGLNSSESLTSRRSPSGSAARNT
jgi:hypothetical protein